MVPELYLNRKLTRFHSQHRNVCTWIIYQFKRYMWFMTTDTFLEYRGIFSNPGTYSGLNRIWCYAIANLILWFDTIWAIWFQNVMFYVIWKCTDTMRLCLFDYIGRKQICVGNTCIRLWLHVPYSGFTLGQAMACRLSGAKGLLAPIMTHYLLNHWKQTSLKYESFLLSDMHLKRHLRNVGHFVQAQSVM